MRPDILMTGPMRSIERRLEPDFMVHKLWLQSNRTDFLANIGPRIRGLVAYSGAIPVDATLLTLLPVLEIIINVGVGYDSIDIDFARRRKIVVANSGSVNAVDVAEHAFGLILDVGRRITDGDRYIRAGRWSSDGRMPVTRRISGRKLGILGLGHIGAEIAKRGRAFDMEIFYHNRRPRGDLPYCYVGSVNDLARMVDILVIATPGGEGTRHLVDDDVLNALGPEGLLINVARGSVVDESALVDALLDNRLGGAGLDVFASEPDVPERLFGLRNVVLQPHQSGATREGAQAIIEKCVANLTNYFNGEAILDRIV
jgi:hydroxypyruvate reductase